MTRSLAISFCLHGLFLLGLVALGLKVGPDIRVRPGRKVTIRPVRIQPKSQTGKLVAGVETGTAQKEQTGVVLTPPPIPSLAKSKGPGKLQAEAAGKPQAKSRQLEKATRTADSSPKLKSPLSALGTSKYPTHKTEPSERTTSKSTEVPLGNGPVDIEGEDYSGDREAKLYHSPGVDIPGGNGRNFIVVRFEVESNGVFDVEIIEGTGDIHADARALRILRRWKWLPMVFHGEKVRSVEIRRLYRWK